MSKGRRNIFHNFKIAYKTERLAWEAVIRDRRNGYNWKQPYYDRHTNRWYLTAKYFKGKVPRWVYEQSLKPKKEKYNNKVLPLAEQKQIFSTFEPTIHKKKWSLYRLWKTYCKRD